jgi:hypothetical protein
MEWSHGFLENSHISSERPRLLRPRIEGRFGQKSKKFLQRRYVQLKRRVRSLTEYFRVPKGDDIRIVFNGTSCFLNSVLWAPNFWLPTSRSATRFLDFDYKTVDIDLGEMFLNFPVAETFQEYSRIDLTPFKSEIKEMKSFGRSKAFKQDLSEQIWGRWERCWMDFRPSPFYTVWFYYWAEEFVQGNRHDSKNPLRWDKIRLNLPGDPYFDPTFPEVIKWDNKFGRVAGNLVAFVDDLRISGHSEEHAWSIARQVAARLLYR